MERPHLILRSLGPFKRFQTGNPLILPSLSKTKVGKIDNQNYIIMLYDVDMEGMQKLISSEHLVQLTEQMNIKNDEMHSFEALPGWLQTGIDNIIKDRPKSITQPKWDSVLEISGNLPLSEQKILDGSFSTGEIDLIPDQLKVTGNPQGKPSNDSQVYITVECKSILIWLIQKLWSHQIRIDTPPFFPIPQIEGQRLIKHFLIEKTINGFFKIFIKIISHLVSQSHLSG